VPSQASPRPSPPAATRNGEIPFADFAQPPSRLYRDFLIGSSRADEFFSPGGWNLDTLADAADRAGSLQRPREALAAALVAQQEPRSQAAAQQASRLTAPDAAVVVTGQQAVLFGGPLYVLYKAVAVVKLAAQLEARRGRPVVPVFWVASDDHDFAEIRSVTLMDSDGRLRSLRYAPTREPVGEPASQIILEPSIDRLFEEAERCLPESPHKATVIDALRACYRPGVSIAAAFAAWISRVLPGLVVIDPSDPSLKKLIMPVLRKEMSEASPSSRAAASVGPRLAAAGYHQQVPVREGFFNLFAHLDGHRRAVAERDGGLEVRGTDVRMTAQEAVALLEEDPSLWSPGVLLRPLAQDLLLPTAGYIGGPSEVAYHAQIGPAYEQFGIPRPVLLPRPSATLVEPPQARALESEGLSLVDLQGEPEPLLTRWGVREGQGLDRGGAAAHRGDPGSSRPDSAWSRRIRARPGASPDRDPAPEGGARAQEARPHPGRSAAPDKGCAVPGWRLPGARPRLGGVCRTSRRGPRRRDRGAARPLGARPSNALPLRGL